MKSVNRCTWVQSPMLKVYLSQLLSSWGDRMWMFAAALFMKELDSGEYDSLQLTAIYSLVLSASVLTLGGVVGSWVDRTERLKAARTSLILQNLSVAASAGIISYMFIAWDNIYLEWNGWLLILLQSLSIITAAVARVASVATAIIVQKDWVLILVEGDLDRLAKVNSTFRTIDLTCQTLAPILVGVINQYVSNLAGAIMIGCWNIVSVALEYYLLHLMYYENPRLGIKEPVKVHSQLCIAKYADHEVCPEAAYKRHCVFMQYQIYKFFYAWAVYFKYNFRFAGIAMAIMYMTVLGFDGITAAYGDTQIGTTPVSISLGLSALFGLFGVLAFPVMRRAFGLPKVGLIGITCQVIALTACLASVWLPGSPFDPSSLKIDWRPEETTNTRPDSVTSIATLYGGIILSRFGLWMMDLTVTQTIQEGADENKRGVVNGVQDSLNMGMDMFKSVLVILYPYMQQFGLLIIISFIFTCMGLLSYIAYYLQNRKRIEEANEEKMRNEINEEFNEEKMRRDVIEDVNEDKMRIKNIEDKTDVVTT